VGRSLGGGSTKAASASVGPKEAGSLGEGTDDGEGMAAAAADGEEEGCDSTTGGGIGTITGGGVGTTGGRGVGTITGGGVGTKGGGVGTITGGGVGTKGGGVGTITRGGMGTIIGGGVGSTAGTVGEGNGMGERPTEVDCKAALCVPARVDGLDVDGLVGGTLRGLFGALFGFATSFPLPGLSGPPDDIVHYFQQILLE